MSRITFAKFRSKKKVLTTQDQIRHFIEKVLSMDYGGKYGTYYRLHVYPHNHFIEERENGTYCLEIENLSYDKPLTDLEKILYRWCEDEFES